MAGVSAVTATVTVTVTPGGVTVHCHLPGAPEPGPCGLGPDCQPGLSVLPAASGQGLTVRDSPPELRRVAVGSLSPTISKVPTRRSHESLTCHASRTELHSEEFGEFTENRARDNFNGLEGTLGVFK
jgi:hypothetical protein